MTKKEVTEIFSVLMLAYPRAEMFQGGIAKLGPTISLWARCLDDVDYWTGLQATLRVCKECVFPPTIAEFRKAVKEVTDELNGKADGIFRAIRSGELLHGTLEDYYSSLTPGDEVKTVIDMMGGTQALVRKVTDGYAWNREAILTTARLVIRNNTKTLGGGAPALPGEKGNIE